MPQIVLHAVRSVAEAESYYSTGAPSVGGGFRNKKCNKKCNNRGREAELAVLTEQLATIHFAIITGMSGIGKTTLAAALARQTSAPQKIFWHTFYKGEGLDSLIWDLAGFLAWHGQADVWRLLLSARQSGGQPPPAEVLINYLIQVLRGHDYLLCFDDFQCVDADPLIDKLVERLRSVLHTGDMALIIISRRAPEFAAVSSSPPTWLSIWSLLPAATLNC